MVNFSFCVIAGIQMLTLLVPVLVNCLLEGPALKEANNFNRVLHDQCLQKLMKIGPQYPQVWLSILKFSTVLSYTCGISSEQAFCLLVYINFKFCKICVNFHSRKNLVEHCFCLLLTYWHLEAYICLHLDTTAVHNGR